MKTSTGICSSCGKEKQEHEIVTLNNSNKSYCEDCYKSLHQEVRCKYCDKGMPEQLYHNHIMNMHC